MVSADQEIDSGFAPNYIAPNNAACLADNQAAATAGGTANTAGSACLPSDGVDAYASYMTKYDPVALMNSAAPGSGGLGGGGPITVSSQYGKPYLYQSARSIRLQLHFTF